MQRQRQAAQPRPEQIPVPCVGQFMGQGMGELLSPPPQPLRHIDRRAEKPRQAGRVQPGAAVDRHAGLTLHRSSAPAQVQREAQLGDEADCQYPACARSPDPGQQILEVSRFPRLRRHSHCRGGVFPRGLKLRSFLNRGRLLRYLQDHIALAVMLQKERIILPRLVQRVFLPRDLPGNRLRLRGREQRGQIPEAPRDQQAQQHRQPQRIAQAQGEPLLRKRPQPQGQQDQSGGADRPADHGVSSSALRRIS